MFSCIYMGAVALALLAQTSPLLFTVGSSVRVDVSLLLVVYVSLFWGGERALVSGFMTGLCQDALSSNVLGLHACSKSLTAFVVHIWSRHVEAQSLMAQGLFTSLAVAVDTGVRLLLMLVLQLPMVALPFVLRTYVHQTLLSLLVAPCVCYSLQWAMRLGHVRPDKG